MKYTTLGSTGAKISRVCLGTMNFGMATDEKESFRIMDSALEHGVNFFDTADFYGNPAGQGITETIVGKWFAQEKQRDRIVLTTKCYATTGNMEVNDRGLSAYHIRRACEGSLKRLQTEHIDVYMMHHYDRGFRFAPELSNINRTDEEEFVVGCHGSLAPSFEEILDAMNRLKTNDKITYIGSANYPGWAIAHFNGIARERKQMGIVVEQSLYNLDARGIERELIPACRELGVGLMTYSPLAGGLLAIGAMGRFTAEQVKKYEAKLGQYKNLCAELGEKPADVAVAWILHNRVVNSVILGPRTVEQLESALHAVTLALPADFLKELDTVWAGTNGEAPECYAW